MNRAVHESCEAYDQFYTKEYYSPVELMQMVRDTLSKETQTSFDDFEETVDPPVRISPDEGSRIVIEDEKMYCLVTEDNSKIFTRGCDIGFYKDDYIFLDVIPLDEPSEHDIQMRTEIEAQCEDGEYILFIKKLLCIYNLTISQMNYWLEALSDMHDVEDTHAFNYGLSLLKKYGNIRHFIDEFLGNTRYGEYDGCLLLLDHYFDCLFPLLIDTLLGGVFMKIGNMWHIRFVDKIRLLGEHEGLEYIEYLLAHPGEEVAYPMIVAKFDQRQEVDCSDDTDDQNVSDCGLENYCNDDLSDDKHDDLHEYNEAIAKDTERTNSIDMIAAPNKYYSIKRSKLQQFINHKDKEVFREQKRKLKNPLSINARNDRVAKLKDEILHMKERLKMIPAESDGNKMYRKYKDLVSKRLDRAMMNIEKIHPEFALYIKKTIFDHRVYCPCIVMPWTTKYSKRIGPAELKLSTIKMIGLENHEYGSEQNEDDNKGNENKRHRSNTIVRRKR